MIWFQTNVHNAVVSRCVHLGTVPSIIAFPNPTHVASRASESATYAREYPMAIQNTSPAAASSLVIALFHASLFANHVSARVVVVKPEEDVQAVIDRATDGDVVILREGIFHGAINIDKSITVKAEKGGEATITNRYGGPIAWIEARPGSRIWCAQNIAWPVHGMLVAGVHAFDYRDKKNFDNRTVGPYWSKGWQGESYRYANPPIYFAHDEESSTLWLQLDDGRNPNHVRIDFNSSDTDGTTLVQKDLGAYWNQQEIVTISPNPPIHPITMWYDGTPDRPAKPRHIDFPKICGMVIEINADNVVLEGLRILMGPTVGVEVNNSSGVVIRDCYFSGYQFAINTGYECTDLTVEHCEMDGGQMVSLGRHHNVTDLMWYHSVYVNPVKFNGTGLKFLHNYVYEGYDLFHPRGRHKDYTHVPDLRSEVAYNVWQNAVDNAIEFDSVEALMNMRFHHNLVLQDHDALAITTTENGGPLTIDHNIWYPVGSRKNRIMKLVGTGRTNRGVEFVHNTYFAGSRCSFNVFEESVFENNLVISGCRSKGCWTREKLGAFFPTRYNLLKDGKRYTIGFDGLTSDPRLGSTPDTIFVPQQGSPAIDTGRKHKAFHQANVTDGKPDLGALEFGQTIDDWRAAFGKVGPRWIRPGDAARKAPHRPAWPDALDPRWGGLDDAR